MKDLNDFIRDISPMLPDLERFYMRGRVAKQRSLEATRQFCIARKRKFIEHNGFIFITSDIEPSDLGLGKKLPDISRLCTDGSFACLAGGYTSLKGAPIYVGNTMDCSENRLKDFTGGPGIVRHSINATGNPLTSLKGLPFWYARVFFNGANGETIRAEGNDAVEEIAAAFPDAPLPFRKAYAIPARSPSRLTH